MGRFIRSILVFALATTLLGLATVPVRARILNEDSYTIERYYAETIAEQFTTSGSFQDVVTLAFTPPSDKDFLITASALTNNSSVDYYTEIQLLINDTVAPVAYSTTQHKPYAVDTNWRSFGTHIVIECTGGTEYTITIQYRTQTLDASTAYTRRAAIAVLEVSDYVSVADEDPSETTETGYQTKLTLNIEPSLAADYLILATANLSNSSATKGTQIQLTKDGTPVRRL
ncbi:hypothetical protein ACFLVD_01385 [Chloroflexota bacterium]